MKKRVLAMLLASAMVLSMAGCGEQAKTPVNTGSEKEQTSTGEDVPKEAFKMDKIIAVVDGTVPHADNYRQEFEDQISAAIGCDVDFNQQDHNGYADAVGRIFASGTDWDVMILSSSQYFSYAQTGALYDITELYENASFKDRLMADSNDALYVDGRLYGFSPTYGNGCVTYIKKAWLDAVGMEAPTNYEEYIALCDAFVNKDPDGDGVKDTYALSLPNFLGGANAEAPYVHYCPEFYQDAYPDIYESEDGTWIDGFNTQSMKDALQRLQDAYAAGYIDPASLTNGTKDVRNMYYEDSTGIFSYWAGRWGYQNKTNLEANGLDGELVYCAPIEEVPGYYDRIPPSWCMNANLTDEEAEYIWKTFFETMVDGGEVMTLWCYGAEGYHWSTAAETVTYGDKSETWEEGQFHMLPNGENPTVLNTKAHIDKDVAIIPLTSGPAIGAEMSEKDQIIMDGNEFFLQYAIPTPLPPMTDLYNDYKGDIFTARNNVIAEVVINGMDVEEAMQKLYVDIVGAQVEEILAELN